MSPVETADGQRIFASSFRLHAGAYGLKGQVATSIGFFVLRSAVVPYAVLCLEADRLGEVLQEKVYLQELPSSTFIINPTRVSSRDHPPEWISHEAVRIKKVDVYSNLDMLRAGVQVFTTQDMSIVRSKAFGIDFMRQQVSNGTVVWHNIRPEYHEAPMARSQQLMSCLL